MLCAEPAQGQDEQHRTDPVAEESDHGRAHENRRRRHLGALPERER